MNQDNRNLNNNNEEREESNNRWLTGTAVVAGVAALAGGLYYYARRNKESQESQPSRAMQPSHSNSSSISTQPSGSFIEVTPLRVPNVDGFSSLLNRLTTNERSNNDSMPGQGLPEQESITNLNSLLYDIYKKYTALKIDDFELHYNIFNQIFYKLHQTMKSVDQYYAQYSSTVSFAGSHFDKLRIKKPDEFDMDIVIDMPVNISSDPLNPAQSDVIFQPQDAGFVELKMGPQFRNLPMRDGDQWQVNKTAYKWMDDNSYLLRSKFIDWFKGLVVRALNEFPTNGYHLPECNVDGVKYTIDRTESGPAITLVIENKARQFRMDVDLVPALKFPETRWPLSRQYRDIPPACRKGYWMLVPKPNKDKPNDQNAMSRSWRIALHQQERELIYNLYNLKITVKLLKKLRDAQCMYKIASYYIKTLFFWEVVGRSDRNFWRKSPAELFKYMVEKFYEALYAGQIPYFWNKNNNLIGGVKRVILDDYCRKLKIVLKVLENPADYKMVAKYLLTPEEFIEYNRKFLNV